MYLYKVRYIGEEIAIPVRNCNWRSLSRSKLFKSNLTLSFRHETFVETTVNLGPIRCSEYESKVYSNK